jgi:hypothetical protein
MARVLGGSTFTSPLDEQEIEVSATSIDRHHGSYLMPSLEHATAADAMHPRHPLLPRSVMLGRALTAGARAITPVRSSA